MSSPALLDGQRYESGGASGAGGTSAAQPGAANTKGAYTEYVTSTSFDAIGFFISNGSSGGNVDTLHDVAIGAAGSEQIIVPDILISGSNEGVAGNFVYFPIAIPGGTRIALRRQASTAATALNVVVILVGAGALPAQRLQRAVNYGAAAADSGGVSIDPGGVANTKGSWVQIAASTSADIKWLVVCIGNQLNTVRTGATWLLDLAIGAAAAEQLVVPDINLVAQASSDFMNPRLLGLPVSIPAGTRLAARASCTTTDATDRLFDLVLIGVG